jgi:DNA polymerase I-like protein with 3'-5' exonuclease and polymerase domains
MQRWFFDFETMWAQDYSLSFMTPPEYIMDPRFEALGCGVIYPDGSRLFVDGEELPEYFDSFDWGDAFVCSHNALFDMLILSLRYAKVPAFYGDTLAMARNWIAHRTGTCKLKDLASYYGLKAKGDTVNKLKGLNLAAIKATPGLYEEMADYAMDDAETCKGGFEAMIREGFPVHELEVIDMVVRMAACPAFELDQMVLAQYLAKVRADKQQLLENAQLDSDAKSISSIMSDQQLAVKLWALGVEKIPKKISKRTGEETYAFAKTDKAFTDLLDHDEPLVQALVAARLGHKSTMEENRTERLLKISYVCPRMPVPLKYSGAHTHRFSGDWKVNLQNLLRGGTLRKALKAPKGKVVVAVDASQIEARMNAELSGEKELVEDFRNGVDVYAGFAEELYGYPVAEETEPKERFVGKTSILSLGYGSSAPVFQNMCRVKGDVHLTMEEAGLAVDHYRRRFKNIVKNWQTAHNLVLPGIANGIDMMWGPIQIEKYAMLLPNGNRLHYPDLRQVWQEGVGGSKPAWMFKRGNMPQFIYGAKLVENAIQALAFLHIMETALVVKAKTGFIPCHQVHDELIFMCDECDAKGLMQLVVQVMSVSPYWMPGVPLAAKGHIGNSYGDLK